MTNATCPPACSGCRDNFVLPELHQHGPLTVFDGPAVRGQIERRRACMLVPDSEKPCLKEPTALDDKALVAIKSGANEAPLGLPTVEQVQRLACAMVADWLRKGIDADCRDGWPDERERTLRRRYVRSGGKGRGSAGPVAGDLGHQADLL